MHSRRSAISIGLMLFSLWIAACGSSTENDSNEILYKFKLLDASTYEPNTVELYFQVRDGDGNPVKNLKANDFLIKEDDIAISVFETEQELASLSDTLHTATILLMDISESHREADKISTDTLKKDFEYFIQKLTPEHPVALYTFDGRTEPILRRYFTTEVEDLTSGIVPMLVSTPDDKSANLNGAVVQSLKILEKKKKYLNPGEVFFGSVVILSRGVDRAARVSDEDTLLAISGSPFHVYTIGYGEYGKNEHFENIGKNGHYFVEEESDLYPIMDEIASEIASVTAAHYGLRFCSSKRAGIHEVELSRRYFPEDATTFTFNADGFEGNCDFSVYYGDSMRFRTLVWQNPSSETEMSLDEAATYCNELVLNNQTGWHLPTFDELHTLVNHCRYSENSWPCATPDCLSGRSPCPEDEGDANGCYWKKSLYGPCGSYWSSTMNELENDQVWAITFQTAEVFNANIENDRHYVRCVKKIGTSVLDTMD